MQRKIFCITLALAFIFGISAVTMGAGMHSDSFSIPTSVFSGGGAPMDSGSINTNSTMGQPSPLMDQDNPPTNGYENYPGFWYTLEAAVNCSDLASFAAAFGSIEGTDLNYNGLCDFDKDGDVDGTDLAEFASNL